MRRSTEVAALFVMLWSRLGVAGPLPPAPTAVALGPQAKHDDLGQRRSIRGATVEVHESEELRALRRFEEDRFGPARARDIGGARGASDAGNPIGTGGSGGGGGARDTAATDEANAFAGLNLPDIPVRNDSHLLGFLELYKSERRGHAIMSAWLKRQGRYRELIETALDRHHLPRALLYVAMIESGYDPHDKSSVGASGVWQFMPAGAQIYGLRMDYWVDERDDPEKATDAVMRYFDDLHAHFGSWHLALAAFNAGYGAVLHSVARYNTNDYWELCRHENGLPWETTLYVPKMLAAATVGVNREAFGYGDLVPDPAWSFDRVTVPPSTTLANVAQAAGVSLDAVALLNPELRRLRTPPEPWLVRLPRGTGPRFTSLFRVHERLDPYRVRLGDRLESIAKAHGTTASVLKRLNAIRDLAEVHPGEVLVLPESARAVVRTDARSDVASDEEITPQVVAVPDRDSVVEGRRRVFYRVAPGDGISEVARFFGVAETDLARWNHLDLDARLIASLVLQVWVDPAFDAAGGTLDAAHLKLVTVGTEEFLDLMEAKKGRRRISYEVRPGDTLKLVGLKYGLSEGDLERINRLGRKSPLAAGQKLTIYVPMDKREAGAIEAGAKSISPMPLPPPPELPLFLADEEKVERMGQVEPVAGEKLLGARSLFPPDGPPLKLSLDDGPASEIVPLPPADDPSFAPLSRR